MLQENKITSLPVFSWLLFMAVVGFVTHSSLAAELTVISYNIRYLNQNDGEDIWSNRKSSVIETLQQADVVGLQEVVQQQLDEIRQGTEDFAWYGVGRDDGDQKGEAVPIGWRKAAFEALEKGTFWLSPSPEAVGSQGWDAALPRIASWVRLKHKASGAAMLVLNTHFDHRGPQARTESAKLLANWLAQQQVNDEPVVILGDLNAELGTAPLDALLAPVERESRPAFQLRDARASAPEPDPGPNSTWNGFSKIEPNRRIDHIMIAGQAEVVAFKTLDPRTELGRFASDHLPVSTQIAIGR